MAKRRPKRRKIAKRQPRMSGEAAAYLNVEARSTVLGQQATAAAYRQGVAPLFALSAALIAVTAIFGHLELGSSDVGLLSWIAIAVTATAWVVGALGERVRLVRPPVAPVTTVTATSRRRRDFVDRDLAEASAERYENETLLDQRRLWARAFRQLVALQTALIVAVELAAR